MQLGMRLFNKEFILEGKTLAQWLIAAGVVACAWFVWDVHEQRDFYRYKCDAYTGMIHQVMNVTQETNPEAFNSWASRMNDIRDSALNYGSPSSDDRFSVGTYPVDSSLFPAPDSTETP